MRLLQANLNHSCGAQDLFGQALLEWQVALAVAAEPYSIPDHPPWYGEAVGSVAIATGGIPGAPAVTLLESGRGYLVVEWGECVVVGCYIPPSRNLCEFEEYLGEVGSCIRRLLPRPVLVLGDFNAHATAWASPKIDARGGGGNPARLGSGAGTPARECGLRRYVRAAAWLVHHRSDVGVPCGRATGDGVEGDRGGGDTQRLPLHGVLRLLY
ncbi:hypothetical protein ANTPLA_LOCUS7961 [Anthophora plagiata]